MSPTEDQRYSGPKAEIGLKMEIIFKIKKPRPKKFVKKICQKKKNSCENEKLDLPRYLGTFYYHGTMILSCISEPTSIRNWVTFCDFTIYNYLEFFQIEPFCYALKRVCFDFCSTNMGSSGLSSTGFLVITP